ncbi:MAG: Pr6Pr family membrane protein [Chitinophagaceae bacterium]
MPKQYSRFATSFMIFTAIVAWLALILQLYISVKNTETNGLTTLVATWNFFSYFTVLTNLLIALCLSFILLSPSSSPGLFFSKPATIAAIALYIFIVGLTYNTILRFIWEPKGLQRLVDETLHVIVPLLFVLFWLLFAPKGTLKWSHPLRWLVYPGVYLVYALLRGEYSGFHAYPFINTAELGYGRVLLNAGGLMLVFIAAGYLFIAIDKKMGSSSS